MIQQFRWKALIRHRSPGPKDKASALTPIVPTVDVDLVSFVSRIPHPVFSTFVIASAGFHVYSIGHWIRYPLQCPVRSLLSVVRRGIEVSNFVTMPIRFRER